MGPTQQPTVRAPVCCVAVTLLRPSERFVPNTLHLSDWLPPPPTHVDFNYTIVVFGAFGVIGLIYWVLVARFKFQGPRARAEAAATELALRHNRNEPLQVAYAHPTTLPVSPLLSPLPDPGSLSGALDKGGV